MSENVTARTEGIHHVGLTVPELGEALAFFVDGLGFHQVGEVPEYPAAFVSDGSVTLTLWQVQSDAPIAADRKRVLGLHHLALRVAGREALASLHERLAAREDVRVEFAPEPLRGGPTEHMMLYIPGNIRVELIAPAKV